MFKYSSARFPKFLTPPLLQHYQHKPWPPPPAYFADVIGELVDDFYDTLQIIKICFSIIIMNILWDVGAVFKKIRAWLRKNFISLLTISSILQQYLLYVSTISPLPFKVSACQHFGLDFQHADVILERSLNTKSSV